MCHSGQKNNLAHDVPIKFIHTHRSWSSWPKTEDLQCSLHRPDSTTFLSDAALNWSA